jgi:hypothetical protein
MPAVWSSKVIKTMANNYLRWEQRFKNMHKALLVSFVRRSKLVQSIALNYRVEPDIQQNLTRTPLWFNARI